MDKEKLAVDAKLIEAMDACVKHARSLLESALAVQAAGHPNIAYHLAALCLEEIGRRSLLNVQSISEKATIPPAWPKKHEQNHIKKLFWCFFGGGFFTEQVTPERLEEITRLARRIHDTRLLGLYVGSSEDSLSIPSEVISGAEAQQLIRLAEARLGMAEAETVRDGVTQEEIDLQAWFLAITDDPEKRKQIFSNKSLAKLAELKDGRAWGRWLKELFEKAEAEGRRAAEEEIERSRNLPDAKTKDKWKLRVRIICASHSIRPAVLTAWNAKSSWIKLSAVSGKRNEILIDFVLGDNVPIQGLWPFGWRIARFFVVALNIGTMGFWWWQMPDQTSRYYESIHDLESGDKVRVERNPSLQIDWGENRIVSEQDLGRVAAVFAALPQKCDVDPMAIDRYLGGLTFLALNDIHWQCEIQSFGNFFECLRAMMAQYGDWQVDTPFDSAFSHFLDDLFHELDERERYVALCRAFDTKQLESVVVTLKEVSFIKLFCDAYFLTKIHPKTLKELSDREGGEPDEQDS